MSEQIPEPTWGRFIAQRSIGDVVDGVVVKVLPFGAFVEIDGVTGPVLSESTPPAVGRRVPVRVTMIDQTRKRFAADVA